MPIIKGHHGKVNITRSAAAPRSVERANQSFRYLTFDASSVGGSTLNEARLPQDAPDTIIALLKQLGAAMIEDSDQETENSTIPPVYTYWGQFIDHDITAGTDRPGAGPMGNWTVDILDTSFTPVLPADVIGPRGLFNLRQPLLDLDSVYGGGPADSDTIQEQIFLKDVPGSGVGTTDPRLNVGRNVGSVDVAPHPDLPDPLRRDLPRHADASPRTGDERNDENTIVAQFHTGFLRFHNAVVTALEAKNGSTPSFDEVARLVRWHYQWLVVNDYLRTVCMTSVVDEILAADTHFFSASESEFMPLEFSVAAFRFGHSMVRANYDFNHNFPLAHFSSLFSFTGAGGSITSNLPSNWIIDWQRFTNKRSPEPQRFARKIDTNLAMPLTNLPSGASALEKHLAQRNLLRSYLLSIPTAQFVAEWLGVPLLSPDDLVPAEKPNLQAAFDAESGLLKTKTPLWYYILREAEVQTGGNSLGELGSRLVAGTLIGLIKADTSAYLYHNWSPAADTGVQYDEKPITTIERFLHFAGVAPKALEHNIFMPFVPRASS